MTRFGAGFLTAPDLFPARIAGEPWGNGEFVVALPGGPYRIAGLTEEQRQSLEDRYTRYAEGAPAVEVALFQAPRSEFLSIDTRGWEYALDFDDDAVAGMQLMARIDIDARRAAIWTPVCDRAEFWGVVENILRPLVARRLLANGGLLVHASAVDLGGVGFLFAAPSGGGKSTLARMAIDAGLPVLSDDLVAVEREGDGFSLVSLPFTGDMTVEETSRSRVALGAVVSLEKGDRESVRTMTRAEAAALLVRTAPYVNRDRRLSSALLERAGEIARSARPGRLTFRRSSEVWSTLTAPWI